MDKIFRIDLNRGTMIYEFYKYVGKAKRVRKFVAMIAMPLPKNIERYVKNY